MKKTNVFKQLIDLIRIKKIFYFITDFTVVVSNVSIYKIFNI
jgi:hypothetical protein